MVTFLGIEIDSVAQELRLPQGKLARILATIRSWEGHQSTSKHDLQSLIGLLNHATAVVRPGHTFLHQLINTMKVPKCKFHQVRLNQRCRTDIARWVLFLHNWNGVASSLTLTQEQSWCQMPRGHEVVGLLPVTPSPGSNSTGRQPGNQSTSPLRSCFQWWWWRLLGQALEPGLYRVPIRQPGSHHSFVQRVHL